MTTNTDLELHSVTATASPQQKASDCSRTSLARRVRSLAGMLLLTLSPSLVGQSHFCIGGDIDHLTPANVIACQAKMAGIRAAVKQRGAPDDWHFVLVCDDAGWKEYTSFAGQEPGLVSGVGYSTDPRLHWTFLRGSDLNAEQPEAMAALVGMVLESVPANRIGPIAPAAKRPARQYGIAMAPRNNSGASTQ